ncbi:MAG: hypothetical protein U9P90_00580 [Patescibacteria group bacterium]|nr:hypothetical protein [Patescibacteria group bacterium]
MKKKKYINLFDDRDRERLPFNWCDKWCERCDKTHKCQIYMDERQRALKHSAEGRNPDDLNVVMEDMAKDFEKVHERMKKDMKKHGLDYEKLMKEAEKSVEKMDFESIKPPEFGITKKADVYMHQAHLFINVLLRRMQFNPYLDEKTKDSVEILNWYHTILPVKLRHVLNNLWEAKNEKGEDDELSLKDAYWTSDIVFKSINLSKQSLESILVYEPGSEDSVNNLLSILKEIEDEFVKILDVALGKHIKIASKKFPTHFTHNFF